MANRVGPSGDGASVFLNVDVELFGTFDREAIVGGFGNTIVVLYEGDGVTTPALSFESAGVCSEFPGVIAELVALVNGLPPDGRVAWDSATRRVFDIGIQGGTGNGSTAWRLPAGMVASLGAVGAEVAFTVYGATFGA